MMLRQAQQQIVILGERSRQKCKYNLEFKTGKLNETI